MKQFFVFLLFSLSCSLFAEKPIVWLISDGGDEINDPDDISAVASYILMSNRFDTRAIVMASTIHPWNKDTADQGKWAEDVYGTAYAADLENLNKYIGGYQKEFRFMESSVKGIGHTFDPNKAYSLEDYPSILALFQEVDKSEGIVNILCYGPLTEQAIFVSYCLQNDRQDVLNKTRFIGHWTSSNFHVGTPTNPERTHNCFADATSCAYIKREALNGSIEYYECGGIGQHGIVEAGPKGKAYYKQFKTSAIGKIFAEGKFNKNRVDDSDSACYWALLGDYGVSLDDISPAGLNFPEVEKRNEETFALRSQEMRDELLRRSQAAAGINTMVSQVPDYSAKKPNIILLLSDDQGYGDIGRHGHPFLKTPNMDQLHDESIRMLDFSVSPTCAPTRAALMTGMHEFKSGVTHTLPNRRKMNRDVLTLPQLLKTTGYATGLFGKWHLGQEAGYRPHERGFDVGLTVPHDNQKSHYNPELLRNGTPEKSNGYRTDIFFDEAMKWMDEQGDNPFFCYIPTYNAHSPLIVPEKYAKPYRDKTTDENTANFFGMIANLDENIGRLTDYLEKRGMADNTIIVFLNDNGATFGADTYNAGMRGVKGTVWRGGTRAFCFWHWPEQWKPRDETMLSAHIDILPTLAELAGIELPLDVAREIEGFSLADFLKDPSTRKMDKKLFQHTARWSDGFADKHQHVNASVRWKSWHLLNMGTVDDCQGECRVYRKAARGESMLYTESPNKHYKLSPDQNWKLYNLEKDPGESANVAQENPKVVKRMAAAYDDWWTRTRPAMSNETE